MHNCQQVVFNDKNISVLRVQIVFAFQTVDKLPSERNK